MKVVANFSMQMWLVRDSQYDLLICCHRRCKMFRFVHDKEIGAEWKERGTGNVKLLKHEERGTVSFLLHVTINYAPSL